MNATALNQIPTTATRSVGRRTARILGVIAILFAGPYATSGTPAHAARIC